METSKEFLRILRRDVLEFFLQLWPVRHSCTSSFLGLHHPSIGFKQSSIQQYPTVSLPPLANSAPKSRDKEGRGRADLLYTHEFQAGMFSNLILRGKKDMILTERQPPRETHSESMYL